MWSRPFIWKTLVCIVKAAASLGRQCFTTWMRSMRGGFIFPDGDGHVFNFDVAKINMLWPWPWPWPWPWQSDRDRDRRTVTVMGLIGLGKRLHSARLAYKNHKKDSNQQDYSIEKRLLKKYRRPGLWVPRYSHAWWMQVCPNHRGTDDPWPLESKTQRTIFDTQGEKIAWDRPFGCFLSKFSTRRIRICAHCDRG